MDDNMMVEDCRKEIKEMIELLGPPAASLVPPDAELTPDQLEIKNHLNNLKRDFRTLDRFKRKEFPTGSFLEDITKEIPKEQLKPFQKFQLLEAISAEKIQKDLSESVINRSLLDAQLKDKVTHMMSNYKDMTQALEDRCKLLSDDIETLKRDLEQLQLLKTFKEQELEESEKLEDGQENKMKNLIPKRRKQVKSFMEKYYPKPDEDLKSLLEIFQLVMACFPNGWLTIDETFCPTYVNLLSEAGMIVFRKGYDDQIQLVDFTS